MASDHHNRRYNRYDRERSPAGGQPYGEGRRSSTASNNNRNSNDSACAHPWANQWSPKQPLVTDSAATAGSDSMRKQIQDLMVKNSQLVDKLQSAKDDKHILSDQLAVKEREVASLTDEKLILWQTSERSDQAVHKLKTFIKFYKTKKNKQMSDQMAKYKERVENSRKQVVHLFTKVEVIRKEGRQLLAAQTAKVQELTDKLAETHKQLDAQMAKTQEFADKLGETGHKLAVNESKLQTAVIQYKKQKAKCESLKEKSIQMANKSPAVDPKLKAKLAKEVADKKKLATKLKKVETKLIAANKQTIHFKTLALISKKKVLKLHYMMTRVEQQYRSNPYQLATSFGQSTDISMDQMMEKIKEVIKQSKSQMVDSIDTHAARMARKNAAIRLLAKQNADKITTNLPDDRIQCPECAKTYSGTIYLDKHIANKHMSVPMDVSQVVALNDSTSDKDFDIITIDD